MTTLCNRCGKEIPEGWTGCPHGDCHIKSIKEHTCPCGFYTANEKDKLEHNTCCPVFNASLNLSQSSLCAEAEKIISGDRRKSYGPAKESFERIALIWSGLLQHRLKSNITAEEVALLMAGFKLGREANEKKRDNLVDAIGYILLKEQIQQSAI